MKHVLFIVLFLGATTQETFALNINSKVAAEIQNIKDGTVAIKKDYDYVAPDQSEIRLFPNMDGQGLAHCLLPKSHVSKAMKHKTVTEVWEFLKGRGEVWLGKTSELEERIIPVIQGDKIEIPAGVSFQFRNTGDEAFEFLVVTEPVWPGAGEAVSVTGHWIDPLTKGDVNENCEVLTLPERELSVYTLISSAEAHGYKIEIFDVHQSIHEHLHDIQTQFLLILEGSAHIFNGTSSLLLGPGGFTTIPPGAVHSITPKGYVRFLSVDIPGFDFPLDTKFKRHEFKGIIPKFEPFFFTSGTKPFSIDQNTKLPSEVTDGVSLKNPRVRKPVQENGGNTVYPLAGTDQWDISIVEIERNFRPADLKASSQYLVLSGDIRVQFNDPKHNGTLVSGQSVHIQKRIEHELSNLGSKPTRILRVQLK